MFKNIAELVNQAEVENKKIYELMLEQEIEESDRSREEILSIMRRNFKVMKNAVARGIQGVNSHSGMTGGDAQKLYAYLQKGDLITDPTYVRALCYAIATNEVNASMGVICATPTAGSSGVLPGVLLAVQEKYELTDEQVILHLFTAGAFGYVIANNAFISGAAGGCQAEIGSASAMTAAALTEMLGGTPRQAAHAMALALKNLLGLTCDPLGGLVEVPCIKRNAAGASHAMMASEMALAGIESKVPWDEVIAAMYQIGQALPQSLRETSIGGLAATETGKRWKAEISSLT